VVREVLMADASLGLLRRRRPNRLAPLHRCWLGLSARPLDPAIAVRGGGARNPTDPYPTFSPGREPRQRQILTWRPTLSLPRAPSLVPPASDAVQEPARLDLETVSCVCSVCLTRCR